MPTRYPVEIAVTPERALAVRWDDGHETVVPINALRDFCPCATCRQARKERAAEKAAGAKRRTLNVLGVATRYEIAGLEHVGNYALGVSWKDDHRSIFAYDYLSEICPCPVCAEERGGPPQPLSA
jgi:DUF971 family protein